MIKLENWEVVGWEHAIRGMRNPKNSWERSDSGLGCKNKMCKNCHFPIEAECYESKDNDYIVGENDHKLMMNLASGGPVHAKYRRMITVYVDITAPLYWWKEFDTYKVGTVANSCSTMHKITDKEFELSDFSYEHLSDEDYMYGDGDYDYDLAYTYLQFMQNTVAVLNVARENYLKVKNTPTKDITARNERMKKFWWQMIQLLPSSYNQKRTVMLNYEVLVGIYKWRKNHKLDEWHDFCRWIESLPYSELITMEPKEIEKEPITPIESSGPRGYVRTEEEIAREQDLLKKE